MYHTNLGEIVWWDISVSFLVRQLREIIQWDDSLGIDTVSWLALRYFYTSFHYTHLSSITWQQFMNNHRSTHTKTRVALRINIHRYIQPLSLFVSELIQPSPDWGWSDVIHWSLSYLSLSRRALPPLIHLSLTGAGALSLCNIHSPLPPAQRGFYSEWFHWEKDGNPLVTSQWLMDSSPE